MTQPAACVRVTTTDKRGRVRLKEKCGQPVRCTAKNTYRFKGQTRCYPRSSFYGLSVRAAVKRYDTTTTTPGRWTASGMDNFFKRYQNVCNNVICRLPMSRVHTKASAYQQKLKRMGIKIRFLGYNEEANDGAAQSCYYTLNAFDTQTKYWYSLTLGRERGSCRSLKLTPSDFLMDGFLQFIMKDRQALKSTRR